ncbi:MAG: 23S rRNA (adenine(2503)-C(2))-methyltransferase RlmN [Bacteroidales bacterium]|nr:23S rRNA (adenine(2503)-C(2))-methyltransferase RlmN [Bacteroidales bacterium]
MMKDIREVDGTEIASFVQAQGEKPFRARQIMEWLWKSGVTDFDRMSNLPARLRESLKEHFTLSGLLIKTSQISRDKTRKFGFQCPDGLLVEGVLIPSTGRVTACLSSQVGCPLNCSFCATARLTTRRNLSAGEIFDQVVLLQNASQEAFGTHLSNLVFMGMGEPLLNYDNVIAAISHMTDEKGLGISPRRITLSTAGLTKGITRLAHEKVKFNLAVSLHTASDVKRDSLMPVNKSNPLSELAESLKFFFQETGTRISYEYLLMKDFNDSLKDASEFAEFCKITPCKINLIEYNEVDGSTHHKTTPERMQAFMDFLESLNMIVNIRRSRGQDIDAACGQLACKSG